MGVGYQMRSAVFLDRDGVINEAIVRGGRAYPPRNNGELRLLPGVIEALSALRSAGYVLVVVTNQPDIARGTESRETVEGFNRWIGERTGLTDFRICDHDDADCCDCRKPKPGLLLRAAKELALDLSSSFMVGDRWRDVEAGCAAGTSTIWLDRGYDEKEPTSFDYRTTSLLEAARWILSLDRKLRR